MNGSTTSENGLTSGDVTTNGDVVGVGITKNTFTVGGTNDYNVGSPNVYQPLGDNVHFGPAGIGLLIMGFLVLGCKYLNSPVFMCPSKKTREAISFCPFDETYSIHSYFVQLSRNFCLMLGL